MTWTKEEIKEYARKYYQSHKEQQKASMKAWRAAHKESEKANMKTWRAANKEHYRAYQKAYMKEYQQSNVNSLGQTKQNIRVKSLRILKKMNLNIPGYQIHHCFGYDDPAKFIYISKELHLKIHQYLRDNNIEADSDHFEQIKHLLDDSVVKFGI